MKATETSKLRSDLTPEQREQAKKIGRIEFKSSRRAWDPEPKKFSPAGPSTDRSSLPSNAG